MSAKGEADRDNRDTIPPILGSCPGLVPVVPVWPPYFLSPQKISKIKKLLRTRDLIGTIGKIGTVINKYKRIKELRRPSQFGWWSNNTGTKAI